MAGPPQPEPENPYEERDKILGWRANQFLQMGFDPTAAELLAHTSVYPPVVKKWLDDGCSLELALRLAREDDPDAEPG